MFADKRLIDDMYQYCQSRFAKKHIKENKEKTKANIRQQIDKNKSSVLKQSFYIVGERVGIRTRDPLIKSQMLYQLSYAPLNNEPLYNV